MQQNLEATEGKKPGNPNADQAENALREEVSRELNKPASNIIAREELLDTEKKVQDLIDAGNTNITSSFSPKRGVVELNIKYPPNAAANKPGSSIKLGLDKEGKLATIGDKFVKGSDGTWRSEGGHGPASKYQNYSFDSETGRYTYQTGKNEGKWIDLDGHTGKVNIHSNGSIAYLDADGKHEYTVRTDGSRYNPRTHTIETAEKTVTHSNGAVAHINANGQHYYTENPDGSVIDIASRSKIRELPNGYKEITHLDAGTKITKDATGLIESAGRSPYNRINYKYNTDQELTKATMVVDGKSELVWTKGNKNNPNPTTAKVLENGTLEITSADNSKATFDPHLIRRNYDPGETTPTLVVKPNGDKRQINADGSITDTYRKHHKILTRTVSDKEMKIERDLARNQTVERKRALPPGTETKVDEQGNVHIATPQREFQLRLANMRHIKPMLKRNR